MAIRRRRPGARRGAALIVVGLVALAGTGIAAANAPWGHPRPAPVAIEPLGNVGGALDDGQSATVAVARLRNTSSHPVEIVSVQALDAVGVDVEGFVRGRPPLGRSFILRWPGTPRLHGPGFDIDTTGLDEIAGVELPPATAHGDASDRVLLAVTLHLAPGHDVGALRSVRITYRRPGAQQLRTADVVNVGIGVCTLAVSNDPMRSCGI